MRSDESKESLDLDFARPSVRSCVQRRKIRKAAKSVIKVVMLSRIHKFDFVAKMTKIEESRGERRVLESSSRRVALSHRGPDHLIKPGSRRPLCAEGAEWIRGT